MSRKKKFFLNTIAGISKQVVAVICGFILPRYMLSYYGSSVNGLVSSISHFLSFISLLDLGVGAVIQANLYNPLAKHDAEQLSRIIVSSDKFFRKLATFFIAYIFILVIIFPSVINKEFDTWFTISLLLIIAFSTFAQYFFGLTYELLLNADQCSYVQLSMQIFVIVVNTIGAIILMEFGATIHTVKLVSSTIFLLRPIGQMLYVKKHYKINRKIEIIGEPIKQKWNGFSQHLASVVCQNIDVVVLTFLSTLKNVSIYSVYFMIVSGVEQIIMTAATGLESMFGSMIANNETDNLKKTFDLIEWIMHGIVSVIFTIAAITIIPFVTIYTENITDANYIVPAFALLLVLAYASECLRIPYFRVIKAAGHFKETQNGAFISAGLNIVITVILVLEFGLIGTAIGTLVSMLYHTFYFVWYLKSHILNRPITIFAKYFIADGLCVFLGIICTKCVSINVTSYFSWILYAFTVSLMVFAICVLVFCLIFKDQAIALKNFLFRKRI